MLSIVTRGGDNIVNDGGRWLFKRKGDLLLDYDICILTGNKGGSGGYDSKGVSGLVNYTGMWLLNGNGGRRNSRTNFSYYNLKSMRRM